MKPPTHTSAGAGISPLPLLLVEGKVSHCEIGNFYVLNQVGESAPVGYIADFKTAKALVLAANSHPLLVEALEGLLNYRDDDEGAEFMKATTKAEAVLKALKSGGGL